MITRCQITQEKRQILPSIEMKKGFFPFVSFLVIIELIFEKYNSLNFLTLSLTKFKSFKINLWKRLTIYAIVTFEG
jgi:hypothetical protein